MARSRRNPPRWFAWALFGGMIVAVAAMAGLGALLYDPLPGKDILWSCAGAPAARQPDAGPGSSMAAPSGRSSFPQP